jgi:hypothetical protein
VMATAGVINQAINEAAKRAGAAAASLVVRQGSGRCGTGPPSAFVGCSRRHFAGLFGPPVQK